SSTTSPNIATCRACRSAGSRASACAPPVTSEPDTFAPTPPVRRRSRRALRDDGLPTGRLKMERQVPGHRSVRGISLTNVPDGMNTGGRCAVLTTLVFPAEPSPGPGVANGQAPANVSWDPPDG